MGARLQGDFYSNKENSKYTVIIDDSTYSSTTFDFDLSTLSWRYQGISKDRFNPILSSTCTLGIVVSNSNIQSCLTDLVGAPEERFRIKILKNDSIYWVGHILLDLAAFEDAPVDADAPPTYTITATDGIGRLKNVDYKDTSGPYSGKATFIDHLFNILGQLNLDDLYGVDDEYLYTIALWFEVNQTINASSDPLINARVDHRTFYTIDKDGNNVYKSCYEVLTLICEAWGARFMHANGKYRFTQINEHEKGNHNSINRYKKDKTTLSDLLAVNHTKVLDTDIVKYRGGTFYYFPGLKEAVVNYKHFSTRNFIAPTTYNVNFASTGLSLQKTDNITLTAVDDNNNTARILFSFKLTYKATYSTPANFTPITYKMRVQIKVGTYYWVRTATAGANGSIDYGEPEWSTTIGYYEFFTNPVITNGFQSTLDISILTDDLPTTGDLEAFLQITNIYNANLTTNTDSFTVDFSMINAYLEILEVGTFEDRSNVTQFTATNDNTGNSAVIEKNTLFGDGPGPNTFGHIEAYDGSAWNVADSWRRAFVGSATYRKFSQLLANEIIAGQYKPVEVNVGTFEGDLEAYNIISKGGVRFILSGGTFNAQRDTWDGEWFEVGADDTQLTVEDSQDFIEDPTGVEDIQISDDSSAAENVTSGEYNQAPIINPPGTVDTDITSGDSPFVDIPIVDASFDDVFLEGDNVVVTNLNSGVTQTFEVDSDVSAGDGTISVVDESPTSDFPIGSYVGADPEQQQSYISRGRHKFIHINLVPYNTDIATETFEWFLRIKSTGVGIDSRLAGARIRECWFEVGQAVSGSPLVSYTMELFRGASTTVVTQNFNGQSTTGRNSPASGEETLQNDVYRLKITRNDASGFAASKGLSAMLVIVY